MRSLNKKSVVAILALMLSWRCHTQSNVYSVAIYSGGTSYREICSLSLPFPPNHYKLTERSWREDSNGLTVMDIQHKNAPGDVLRRSLEVESGSETFVVPLDTVSKRKIKDRDGIPFMKESGDISQLVTQCATNRGGYMTTNTLPVIQASWIRQSRTNQDIIVVDGDRFTELQTLLEQVYGKPNVGINSSAPIVNDRSLTYSPGQTGVVLNLSGDSTETIVSVMGKQKP
jgi:hypothetical protein